MRVNISCFHSWYQELRMNVQSRIRQRLQGALTSENFDNFLSLFYQPNWWIKVWVFLCFWGNWFESFWYCASNLPPFLWMHWIRTCIVMFNWVPKEVEFNKLSVLLTWPPSWMMSKLIPNHRASNFFNYRPRNCMKLTCTYTRLLMMAHMKSESIVSNKKKLLAEWWLPGLPAMHSFFF